MFSLYAIYLYAYFDRNDKPDANKSEKAELSRRLSVMKDATKEAL